MTLAELIHDESKDIDAIASYLDGLAHDDRMAELQVTSRKDQRELWGKAARQSPLTLEHFVGSKIEGQQEVVHHGRNTLPLPFGHKFFQKPFARPKEGGDRLFGYNKAPSGALIGPGYFVAVPTEDNKDWTDRGAIVVDYFQVPDSDVPEHWPRVRPNSSGLQVFVYHRTRDFMRKVSEHVSIGAAFKGEKALDHYFTLCRQD